MSLIDCSVIIHGCWSSWAGDRELQNKLPVEQDYGARIPHPHPHAHSQHGHRSPHNAQEERNPGCSFLGRQGFQWPNLSIIRSSEMARLYGRERSENKLPHNDTKEKMHWLLGIEGRGSFLCAPPHNPSPHASTSPPPAPFHLEFEPGILIYRTRTEERNGGSWVKEFWLGSPLGNVTMQEVTTQQEETAGTPEGRAGPLKGGSGGNSDWVISHLLCRRSSAPSLDRVPST